LKSKLEICSQLSKFLVLYPKCGILGGVLGLFASIRWCFCILIDSKRLPKCSSRVVFLYPLRIACLSLYFLALLLTASEPCVRCTGRASPVRSYCPQLISCSQAVRDTHCRAVSRVHLSARLPILDLGSLSVVCSEFCKARYITP